MKRLFILVVLLAAGIAALGFYRGYFSVTTEKTLDGKTNTTLTVDNEKVKALEQKAENKLGEWKGKVENKAVETVKDQAQPAK